MAFALAGGDVEEADLGAAAVAGLGVEQVVVGRAQAQEQRRVRRRPAPLPARRGPRRGRSRGGGHGHAADVDGRELAAVSLDGLQAGEGVVLVELAGVAAEGHQPVGEFELFDGQRRGAQARGRLPAVGHRDGGGHGRGRQAAGPVGELGAAGGAEGYLGDQARRLHHALDRIHRDGGEGKRWDTRRPGRATSSRRRIMYEQFSSKNQ